MAGVQCGQIDLSRLSEDNIIVSDQNIWLKAEVEEKIYLWDRDGDNIPEPYVVIKFEDPCFATICDDQTDILPSLLFLSTALEATKQSTDDDGQPPNVNKDNANEIKAKNVCALDEELLRKAQKSADAHSANLMGYQPAAVMPAMAVVPMKSNIMVYGPYASPNFGSSAGGTQVTVDADLCPWVFGSVEGMNAAANSMVASSAIGLTRSETGSVTVPGLPDISGLGVVVGSAGPNISNISFSFGSSGVTTSYEFRTYTPKFGSLNRHFLDKFKSISKNRQTQLRFLRNNQIVQNKINRKIQKNNRAKNKDAIQSPGRAQCLQRVLVGEITDHQTGGNNSGTSQRTVVGIDPLDKSVVEMIYDYDKKAYMGLDGLLGPVSINGDGGLPQYASFETNSQHKASPIAPQPPFTVNVYSNSSLHEQYNLEITQKYLNPLTNKFQNQGHHHTGAGDGHVIDLVGREQELPVSGLITNFYKPDSDERYSDDYRFLGMRGPIVLHSWGYDLDGKPIPNEADIEEQTKQGSFKKDSLKDAFLQDWLKKPATWPVAPIDFRFDRKRGLWVTPPGYKVVVAKLEENLPAYGSANAKLINKDTEHNATFGDILYDKDGNEVKATQENDSNAKIKIEDRIGSSYTAGTKAYCYYDTFSSKYIILSAVAVEQKSIRFRIIDVCGSSAAEPNYGDNWTKYAGYRDKYLNNHILGIRINCNGDTINSDGNIIAKNDIDEAIDDYKSGDANRIKHKKVFVNLFDTCGVHGPSFAHYNGDFNEWKNKASTGFGLICFKPPENTCGLGNSGSQCLSTSNDFSSYDIVFLESYARFVECTLTQALYTTSSQAQTDYPNDTYKKDNPEGNASATILKFYGGSPNHKEPEFYKNDFSALDFRVFDPYSDAPKEKNPFAQLKYGDKVLAIFNEKEKKYVIYSSLKYDEKVIKFALVDNKDVGDQISRAVLVDLEGHPIDEAGIRLTANNFANNFITVIDSFAIHGLSEPFPKYYNTVSTSFGPALGSANFTDHLWGFNVQAGDWDAPLLPGKPCIDAGGLPIHCPPCCDPPIDMACSSDERLRCFDDGQTDMKCACWKSSPFIGYAIRKAPTSGISSTFQNNVHINEIIFLETFADIIVGKIASTSAIVENKYHLGVLRDTQGFVDGRRPFTRHAIAENTRANLRVLYPIDQHYAGKYITGDFYDDDFYQKGDVFNNTDGCRFVAKLDRVTSKVNVDVQKGEREKLYYLIVEVDNIANRVKTHITKTTLADELNAGEVKQKSADSEGIISQYMDGFVWDKQKSKTHYEQITIFNRLDWAGKALFIENSNYIDTKHIESNLAGYFPDGRITYQVDHAGTIAQVAEATVPSALAGRFGFPNGVPNIADKRISKFDTEKFYHGLDPSHLVEGDQPTIDVSNPWMVYEGAGIVSLWDETSSANVKNAKYRVVYAREAPVIITGYAYTKFLPTKSDNIQIDVSNTAIYPSCPGVTQNPVNQLLLKVKNPMGYGAAAGDLVTLQRVFINNLIDNANYYYIIIGTGSPPGKDIPNN